MASDVAFEIVKAAVEMERLKVQQLETERSEQIWSQMTDNMIALDINFTYLDEEDGEIMFSDYLFQKFSIYNNEIFWICTNNSHDMKVINISQNPNIIKILLQGKQFNSGFDEISYNSREKMALIIKFQVKHTNEDGNEYTCFCVEGDTMMYDKDASIENILNDGLEIIKCIHVIKKQS